MTLALQTVALVLHSFYHNHWLVFSHVIILNLVFLVKPLISSCVVISC